MKNNNLENSSLNVTLTACLNEFGADITDSACIPFVTSCFLNGRHESFETTVDVLR